ncbi:MAG: hypothetical protein K6A71_10170 [Lachnospiraceae bacterium]|nr:hypothetical protein [Lachnospiraceae bacterium]
MDILKPLAVVGTNSWGSAVYGKVLRGESVDIDTIRKCYDRAKEKDLLIFDLAQDYGREYVDIYWLHLPSDIEKNLKEIITLIKEGKIKHDLNIPQVAMAFCVTKGIVPICGCRKPYQVDDLYAAANAKLTDSEIKLLENEADKINVKILGSDMFRFAVKKNH